MPEPLAPPRLLASRSLFSPVIETRAAGCQLQPPAGDAFRAADGKSVERFDALWRGPNCQPPGDWVRKTSTAPFWLWRKACGGLGTPRRWRNGPPQRTAWNRGSSSSSRAAGAGSESVESKFLRCARACSLNRRKMTEAVPGYDSTRVKTLGSGTNPPSAAAADDEAEDALEPGVVGRRRGLVGVRRLCRKMPLAWLNALRPSPR